MGRLACLMVTVALAAGCSAVQLEDSPPPDFDLSGHWTLVAPASETAPSRRHLRAQGGMLAFVTQDFPVLRATEMVIEQSRDSMGIRYDDGDYRDISWGTRQRGLWEVRAGWHEGELFILSEARDADARETLRLSPDGRQLTIDVRISSTGDDLSLTRVYRRAPP